MSNGSGTGSPLAPAYTVFLDPKQWSSADSFYKTFGSEGSLKVAARPAYFKGDLISLLETIILMDTPYVLLVTHAWETGVSIPLAQHKKHYEPVSAGRTALSLLLVFEVLRTGIRQIEQKPRDKQTVEQWQALNQRRRRYADLANDKPLEALRAAQKEESFDSKHDLDEGELERFELDGKKQELMRKPGDHSKELQILDSQIRNLEATRRKRDEEKKDNFKKEITDWMEQQRAVLKLNAKDLDVLLSGLAAVRTVKLKDVQIRGCNLGKDPASMELLRLFLSADTLEAPKVKTAYASSIPVHIESHSLSSHRVCKQSELLQRSGCWWSFDEDDFQIFIKAVKHHRFEGQAHSVSKAAMDKWVKDHFGLPRRKLGNSVPIHFLFTAPPAFPLDSDFERNLESVSR